MKTKKTFKVCCLMCVLVTVYMDPAGSLKATGGGGWQEPPISVWHRSGRGLACSAVAF